MKLGFAPWTSKGLLDFIPLWVRCFSSLCNWSSANSCCTSWLCWRTKQVHALGVCFGWGWSLLCNQAGRNFRWFSQCLSAKGSHCDFCWLVWAYIIQPPVSQPLLTWGMASWLKPLDLSSVACCAACSSSPAASSCLLPAWCVEDQLLSLRQLELCSLVFWVKLTRTANATFHQW